MVREVGGYWNYNGEGVFDRNFIYAAADNRTTFRLFALERDIISKHVEGNDARKNLNR